MAGVDARPKGKDPPRAHPEHAEGVDLLWPVQECLGIPHQQMDVTGKKNACTVLLCALSSQTVPGRHLDRRIYGGNERHIRYGGVWL